MTDSEFLANRNINIEELDLSFDIAPRGIWFIAGPAASVLAVLVAYQDWEYKEGKKQYTGVCSLSNQNIADLLEIHLSTVKRHLNLLESKDFVRTVRIGGDYKKVLNYSRVEEEQRLWDEHAASLGINRSIRKHSPKGLTPVIQELVCEPQKELQKLVHELPKGPQKLVCEPHINTSTQIQEPNTTTIEPVGSKKQQGDVLDQESLGPSHEPTNTSTENVGDLRSTLDPSLIELGIAGSERKVLSAREKKKLKGIDRLIHGGEAKPTDLIDYFNKRFEQVYKRPINSKLSHSPSMLAILRNGFMKLYSRDQWLPLIDTLIEDYDKIPGLGDKYPQYPTPSISCLSQHWIMNLVAARLDQKKAESAKLEATTREKQYEERLKQLPEMSTEFYYYLLEALGEDLFRTFDSKYKEGKLNHCTWFDNYRVPLEQVKEDILNA